MGSTECVDARPETDQLLEHRRREASLDEIEFCAQRHLDLLRAAPLLDQIGDLAEQVKLPGRSNFSLRFGDRGMRLGPTNVTPASTAHALRLADPGNGFGADCLLFAPSASSAVLTVVGENPAGYRNHPSKRGDGLRHSVLRSYH